MPRTVEPLRDLGDRHATAVQHNRLPLLRRGELWAAPSMMAPGTGRGEACDHALVNQGALKFRKSSEQAKQQLAFTGGRSCSDSKT
jgi:hypothetical protein